MGVTLNFSIWTSFLLCIADGVRDSAAGGMDRYLYSCPSDKLHFAYGSIER